MSKETSEAVASIAGRVMNRQPRPALPLDEDHNQLVKDAKSLAASALAQREDDPNTGPITRDYKADFDKLLLVLHAAERLSQMYRTKGQTLDEEFFAAINAVDVACAGGGATPVYLSESLTKKAD